MGRRPPAPVTSILFPFLCCAIGASASDADAPSYVVHALSATHRRPAAWSRTKCGSVKDPHNMTDIITAFGSTVTPDAVWPEHPRPQLMRGSGSWRSLNGLWEFGLRNALDGVPFGETLPQTILVPFPLESCLSGAFRWPEFSLWVAYRLLFDAPFTSGRTLLHFGAVDWNATVFLNGERATQHLGGYSGFSIDATHLLKPTNNELIVLVYDPNGVGSAPAGKQRYTCLSEPASIWYGTVTGIWQPVWLENVPAVAISKLKIHTDLERIYVRVVTDPPAPSAKVGISVFFAGQRVASDSGDAGAEIDIEVPNPQLWTPASPNLYNLSVTLTDAATGASDTVTSYAGMRTISLGSFGGATRPALNGKPIFFTGVLDQSWWPDGVYTAPNDQGLAYDFELVLSMGFNTVRAHQKHGMERWYWHADRMGILILQDAPGIMVPFNGRFDSHLGMQYWQADMLAMIDEHSSHPSIVQWNLFNEDSENHLFDTGVNHTGLQELIALVRAADATGRLVDLNTGGGLNRFWLGDVNDVHSYPVPVANAPNATQYSMDGEYGGMGTFAAGTAEWVQGGCFAYNAYDPQGYVDTWLSYATKVLAYKVSPGLSSVIYTQLTDVETECDGLVSFDRSLKFNTSQVAAFATMNAKLINAPVGDGFADVIPAATPRPMLTVHAPQRGLAAQLPRRLPLPALTAPSSLDLAGAAMLAAAPPQGLAIWFDASNISGVEDGAPLLKWQDLSGGGFDVEIKGGNVAVAPTFLAKSNFSTGLPSVLFDASRHTNLYNAFWQAFAEQTLLAVIRDRNTNSTCCASVMNSFNNAVSGTNGITLVSVPNSTKTVPMVDFNGFGEAGTTSVRGRPVVISNVYGPLSFVYVNGKRENVTKSAPDAFHGAFSFSLCVGSRNDEGNDRYFDGEVGEILAYNRQLGDAEHAQAVAYLMAKWGIHPY